MPPAERPEPVYLDHNATTPIAEPVREAMLPWLGANFGNPSSGHVYGRRAAEAVARAREEVAALVGGQPEQIVFTGGGTEADNLAIRRSVVARERIVTSAVEHPAVEEPARALQAEGWRWDRLGVDGLGRVDLARAEVALSEPAGLLSVISAQNETGVLQPVSELAAMAKACSADTLVHTDAAQAVGKIPVDVTDLGVDLMTIVSHKLYGPCGIGALWIREPGLVRGWALGGGQEQGVRPGTEPTAMIVGLGAACRLAASDLQVERARVEALRDALQERLLAAIPGLVITGRGAARLPNTLHVCVPGCTGAALLARTPEVAASTGSACHGEGEGGVLQAMGLEPSLAAGALRLSLGRRTQAADVELAAEAIVRAWADVVRS